jgi:hypothetical protein
LIGQRNVVVYKSDLQSRCDSLVYAVSDSTFYFYKKPIVWSESYQMEADTLTAKMKNNRINTMLLRGRSFVVSQDTLKFFNQIKGRSITASFRTVTDTLQPPRAATARRPAKPGSRVAGQVVKAPTPPRSTTNVPKTEEKTVLNRVIVEGNGQSIYYVVDEKNVFTGMNRVDCSKMNIEFKKNRVGTIRFYGQPDGSLTPPKQLLDSKKYLEGFRWRDKDRPTKAQVLELPPDKLSTPSANVPAAVAAPSASVRQSTVDQSLPVNKSGIKFDAFTKPLPLKMGQKQ